MLKDLGCKETLREEDICIAGDRILVVCRKKSSWIKSDVQSGQHHYYETTARMNAFAKLEQAYRNIKKSTHGD